jgi:hypothetical protein
MRNAGQAEQHEQPKLHHQQDTEELRILPGDRVVEYVPICQGNSQIVAHLPKQPDQQQQTGGWPQERQPECLCKELKYGHCELVIRAELRQPQEQQRIRIASEVL